MLDLLSYNPSKYDTTIIFVYTPNETSRAYGT